MKKKWNSYSKRLLQKEDICLNNQPSSVDSFFPFLNYSIGCIINWINAFPIIYIRDAYQPPKREPFSLSMSIGHIQSIHVLTQSINKLLTFLIYNQRKTYITHNLSHQYCNTPSRVVCCSSQIIKTDIIDSKDIILKARRLLYI